MFKASVLDCLHSKARWFAIHQRKKVSFQINPNLERNEDLHKAVHELQFTPDYHDPKQTRSEVFAEVYGQKYPLLTVHEMKFAFPDIFVYVQSTLKRAIEEWCFIKESQFWPFVASNKWSDCTSLRVTEGDLLFMLEQTYREMEEAGHIFRYTTNIYDTVVMSKARVCMKSPPTARLSTSSDVGWTAISGTLKSDHTKVGEELTKITFTYYGTSVEQLHTVLTRDGILHATLDEIRAQNSPTSCHECTTHNLLSLWELCNNSNAIVPEPTVLRLGNPVLDERKPLCFVDMSGRQRKVFKRRFTVGQISWDQNREQLLSRDKNSHINSSILNPLYRVMLLGKKRTKREIFSRKNNMYCTLENAFKDAANPYERWWFNRQNFQNLVNVTNKQDLNPSSSFFENSWILESVSSSCQQNSEDTEYVRKKVKDGKLLIHDVSEVDSWNCQCDVCTGGLLDMYCSTRAPQMLYKRDLRRLPADGNQDQPLSECYLHETSNQDGRQTDIRKISVTCFCKHKEIWAENSPHLTYGLDVKGVQIQRGGNHPEKRKKSPQKHQKVLKKTTKPRKLIADDVWWKSLSTYNTPYWQKTRTQRKYSSSMLTWHMNASDGLGLEHGINLRGLKINYSFDKLKRKPQEHQSDEPEEIKPEDVEVRPQTSAQIIDDAVPNRNTELDTIDFKALDAHGIIYKYTPDLAKEFLKINTLLDPLKETNLKFEEKSAKDLVSSPVDNAPVNLSTVDEKPSITKKNKNPRPPDNEILRSEEKCNDFLNSDQSLPFMFTSSNDSGYNPQSSPGAEKKALSKRIRYFDCGVPDEFEAMCIAALRSFVIRRETVVTSKTFQRVDSLTVNRMPFCSYAEEKHIQRKSF